MDIGDPISLAQTLQELLQLGHNLELILPVFTRNVARVTGLSQKGQIAVGADADLVVLSPDGAVGSVMAQGQWMMRDGEIINPGNFEV